MTYEAYCDELQLLHDQLWLDLEEDEVNAIYEQIEKLNDQNPLHADEYAYEFEVA